MQNKVDSDSDSDNEFYSNLLRRLASPTGLFFRGPFLLEENENLEKIFFEEYKSASDFFIRNLCNLLAPISLSFFAITFFVISLCEFLFVTFLYAKFFIGLDGENSMVEEMKDDYKKSFATAFYFLVGAVLSPLGNFLDFIGSLVHTADEDTFYKIQNALTF